MALSEGISAADLAAIVGNNDGFGGGNGAWWLLILLIFANNGWGNNGFGGNNGYVPPYATATDVQSGFDQAAVISGINGITSAISNGFSNAEISRANTLANITNQMNTIAMNQQACCCENRASVADLKYTVATEACADRAAVTAGTQSILNAINNGIQSIQDKLCQQEIDALKTQNANLQQQLTMASLAASQNLQTQQILAGQESAVNAVERYLAPTPVPAYVVQNPNCCGNYYANGCGCNG